MTEDSRYIIEYIAIGSQVKVTAIDTSSGIEASTFGPAKTPKSDLERLAIQKLEYVKKKRKPDSDDNLY